MLEWLHKLEQFQHLEGEEEDDKGFDSVWTSFKNGGHNYYPFVYMLKSLSSLVFECTTTWVTGAT